MFEEFWDYTKDTIMEEAVVDEKHHNKWGHCSDPFYIRNWRELAKKTHLMQPFEV